MQYLSELETFIALQYTGCFVAAFFIELYYYTFLLNKLQLKRDCAFDDYVRISRIHHGYILPIGNLY